MSKHGWTEKALLECGCDYDFAHFARAPQPGEEGKCHDHGPQPIRAVVRLNWTTGVDVFRGIRERGLV